MERTRAGKNTLFESSNGPLTEPFAYGQSDPLSHEVETRLTFQKNGNGKSCVKGYAMVANTLLNGLPNTHRNTLLITSIKLSSELFLAQYDFIKWNLDLKGGVPYL